MSELIFPTINFVCLVTLLTVFLRKPVKKMILDRHAAMKDKVEGARAQRDEAEKRLAELQAKLRGIDAEAGKILEQAKHDAEQMKDMMIRAAHESAARIIHDSEQTARANLEDYKDQVRREIIARSVETAERMIQAGLSQEDQRRIVTEYVGKVQ